MIARNLLALLPTTLLLGCAALPSVVTMPTAIDSTSKPYEPELKPIREYMGVYPLEVTPDRVIQQASLYAATWRKASTELLVERDVANNAQFGSTVAGAYNTATGSLRAAKWWLAGAAGIGLTSERYQIEAQARQYANGATAMECVRREVASVPSSAWAAFQDGHFLQTVPEGITTDKVAEASKKDLDNLFTQINLKMSDIANKVRANVNSKTLTTTSAEDITNAVNKQINSKKEAEQRANTLFAARAQARIDVASALVAHERNEFPARDRAQAADDEYQRMARNELDLKQAIYSKRLQIASLVGDEAEIRASRALTNQVIEEMSRAVPAAERLTKDRRDARDSALQTYSGLKTRGDALRTFLRGPDPTPLAYASALELPTKLEACAVNMGS